MPSTLASSVHSDLAIRKSRFIGCVQPVADRRAAIEVVEALRRLHPGAAHVCWALLAGGQSAAVDDGEPGGTAGRPMLEVLRHQDLDGVLATVVRYYGGIKLGAGGLVRAYTDAVAQALVGAEKVAITRSVHLACRVPYAMEGTLRRELASAGAMIHMIRHTDRVEVAFSVPEPACAGIRARLGEQCHGRLEWIEPGRS